MSVVSSRAWIGTALAVLTGVLAGLFIAGSDAAGDPTSLLTGPLRFFALTALAAVVLTSLHETAHALVARLAGWHLFGVTIGQGRRHASIRLGDVRVDLRGALIGGVTIARPTGRRWPDAAMLVAGVTVETLIIVAALVWSPASALGQQAKWAVIVVACVDIVVNLWPRRLDVGPVEGMATDGAQLLSVLTTPDQWRHDAEQLHEQLTVERADLVQTLYGGDIEHATELALAHVAADPADDDGAILAGTLLLLGGQWRPAFEHLAPRATAPDADPLVANNAAWAAAMTFDPTLLATADRLSERALTARPDEPACANTRGATLVLQGRAGEGLPLLLLAASGRLSRKQKAYVFAFTALADHRLGRHADAADHIAKSAMLDSKCPALRQVRRFIEAETAGRLDAAGANQHVPWPAPNAHERIAPT